MTQTIDPVKLKACAEHLEWVLKQYPDEPVVQELLEGLLPLIEDAKAGRVKEPVEKISFGYALGDGAYMPYKSPNVGDAYAAFAIEMEGGFTEQDKRALARMQAIRDGMKSHG